jgi:hypothetical protein
MARLCHRLKAWGPCPWPRTARGLSGSLRGCAGSSSQRLTKAGGAEHDGGRAIAATATDRNVWSEGTENPTLSRSVPGADLMTLKSSWLEGASPRGRFRTNSGRSLPSTATAAYAPFRPLPHADAEVSGGVIMKTSRRAATSWLTGAMPKIRGDRLSGADAGRPCSRCSEDRHRSSCCVVDHGRNYAMRRSTRPADRAFVR